MERLKTAWRRMWPPYVANFFYSLHYAATLYINSSFLENFFNWREIIVLYVLGALLSLIGFIWAPKIIKLVGGRRFFFVSLVVQTLAILGLAVTKGAFLAAVSFIVYGAFSMLIYYALDLALESLSTDAQTGEIRGSFLTLSNVSIALAPLVIVLYAVTTLQTVYWAALFLLLPLYLVGFFFVFSTNEPPIPFNQPSGRLDFPDIKRVTLSRVCLEYFYAVMTIFVPAYLYTTIGFTWQEIGFMFSIMLLAFVFFEWPAGVFADEFWGEKEMMTLGHIVMAASVLGLIFVGHNFAFWTALLFLSRFGASLTEITCESYFFKHVAAKDTKVISSFRTARPAGVILGAILGGIAFAFSFQAMFISLAAVMLIGATVSSRLVDTK